LPVDPISKAMTHPLRSTGITPLQHYKETDSPPQLDSNEAATTYERFIRCGCGSAKPVANYYEAVRPSPAHQYFRPRGWSRLCLVPLASPARFSRSIQVDHRHCRPAANETMLGLRRAVGTEVVHWLGANKPAYKLDPGFLEHPRLSPRAVIGPARRPSWSHHKPPLPPRPQRRLRRADRARSGFACTCCPQASIASATTQAKSMIYLGLEKYTTS
jgi:hypothetical protein